MGRSAAARLPAEVPDHSPDVSRLFEILGLGNVGNRIAYAFGLISMAEEEINKMKKQYPEKADAINKGFQHLRWVLPKRATEEVFRSHTREILLRIVNGKDIQLGTLAECLIAMSESSLRAPLNTLGLAVMYRLFAHVYGKDALPGLHDVQEPYTGACDEMIGQLQRKLSNSRMLG